MRKYSYIALVLVPLLSGANPAAADVVALTCSENSGSNCFMSIGGVANEFSSIDFPDNLCAGSILDVDVRIESFAVNDGSSMDVNIIGPSTAVVLYSDYCPNGFTASSGTFDDEAVNNALVCDSNNPDAYKPLGSLSGFDGEDPTGTWSLQVRNSSSTSELLSDWTLLIECDLTAPPIISVQDGYFKLDTLSGSAPANLHCSDVSHYGRMAYDESNNLLYICDDSGWISK